MGRPFATELGGLLETYSWARNYDIKTLRDAIRRARGPLLAIGSGGSLTAAAYAAYLHEEIHGFLSRSATPLEAKAVAASLRGFHGFLVSAGGRNRDALQACASLIRAEPNSLTVLCGSKGSPLARLAKGTFASAIEELSLPGGKDGFLATNSLLAFCVLLLRAYTEDADDPTLPETLPELLGTKSMEGFAAGVAKECRTVLDRDTLLVIHGPATRTVAIDLESKFSEAALGSVHIADYRNFSHGRHHWLAKRGARTGVIALVHESDEPLAKRTLGLLPPKTPVARIKVSGTRHQATLSGLVTAFHLTGLAGVARDIDPGRPGVPAFGSRLYSLRVPPEAEPPLVEVAARRKMAATAASNRSADQWRAYASDAISTLATTTFAAVALDFDGTICGPEDRYSGLRAPIVQQLRLVLDAGLLLGIATGRGRSVGKAMRTKIPSSAWSRVLVGYYNGACVVPLDQELSDDVYVVDPVLKPLADALVRDSRLAELVTIERRRSQITIECAREEHRERVWDIIQSHVVVAAVPDVVVVRSSHSIDVLAPGVSKVSLVRSIEAASGGAVLRIGDRGRFPGNDFALLDSPLGLSVDEVSTSEDSCWNLAPAGVRGVDAAVFYLKALRREVTGFHLALGGTDA